MSLMAMPSHMVAVMVSFGAKMPCGHSQDRARLERVPPEGHEVVAMTGAVMFAPCGIWTRRCPLKAGHAEFAWVLAKRRNRRYLMTRPLVVVRWWSRIMLH